LRLVAGLEQGEQGALCASLLAENRV